MKLEEQFPSLKFSKYPLENGIQTPNVSITNINHLPIWVIPEGEVKRCCLDKGKEYKLSENEMHDLIVKGRVTMKCGLKLDATTKFEWERQSKIFQKIKEEHILLEEYKQKVRGYIISSLKEGFSEEWISKSLETTNEVQLLASMIMDKLGLD